MKPREYKGMGKPGHCLKCGKKLDMDKAVWLALDTRINCYTNVPIPPEFDQGGFEFGPDCAAKEIRLWWETIVPKCTVCGAKKTRRTDGIARCVRGPHL